ncbi:MAG: high-affinity iron transporter [Mycobacterium sp.]|jgi:high-affinity iron transporter|nr:high-affinity iron transporter [Mycobacterium sp.]
MQGVFIGTFLIGLREGLEATLIVSIVGAFLKRNGQSTRPMFAGVALAVLISVAVGVGLDLLQATLPQAQQEMMETVIGAIAVVFVTSMIIWMNRNAARLKGELEREAQQALNRGGSLALVTMAFLAVLKEGFETAVFLLAAAQTSHGSRWLAVLGGAAGIAASIAVGIGRYFGGLKLNLGRFFRVTGVFLVLIAAGLVMGALRTAHEAGWVTIGQPQVFNFSSWMSGKSVQGALITGVFGIPAEPRLIEVLGWLLYTAPVLVVFLWPSRLAAAPRARRRLLAATSAALLIVAGVLAIVVPAGGAASGPRTRTVTDRAGHTATVSLAAQPGRRSLSFTAEGGSNARTVELAAAGDESVDGVPVRVWQTTVPADPGPGSTTVTLEQLSGLTGGRLPVGVSLARTPGPFQAQWAATTVYTVLAHGDIQEALVSAQAASNRTAVLTGGGLTAPKTVSVGGLPTDWSTAGVEDHSTAAQIAASARERAERQLWKVWLPLVLAAFALACVVGVVASARGGRTGTEQPENERKDASYGEAHQPGKASITQVS